MLGGEMRRGENLCKGLSLIPEQSGKGATAAAYSDRKHQHCHVKPSSGHSSSIAKAPQIHRTLPWTAAAETRESICPE